MIENNHVQLTGLTPGAEYKFIIRAKGISGFKDSDYTAIQTFTTPITEKLAAPTGLSATNITSTSARLSWNEVENATGYNLEYRPQGTSEWTEQL